MKREWSSFKHILAESLDGYDFYYSRWETLKDLMRHVGRWLRALLLGERGG
jgi:hypothetical protein